MRSCPPQPGVVSACPTEMPRLAALLPPGLEGLLVRLGQWAEDLDFTPALLACTG